MLICAIINTKAYLLQWVTFRIRNTKAIIKQQLRNRLGSSTSLRRLSTSNTRHTPKRYAATLKPALNYKELLSVSLSPSNYSHLCSHTWCALIGTSSIHCDFSLYNGLGHIPCDAWQPLHCSREDQAGESRTTDSKDSKTYDATKKSWSMGNR